MAISIWRCHIMADTSTQRLAEAACYTDNSRNLLKDEVKVSIYAKYTTPTLTSKHCPTRVQWDTINYNQATLKGLNGTLSSWMLCYA
ncbi:hypothetical protein D3C71_1916270 [compost metagenome]